MQEEIDIRAELLAAELVVRGVPNDRIVVHPTGTLHRSHRKDLHDFQLKDDESYDDKERYLFFTCREGLYDMLPQGLFHQSAAPRNANQHEVLQFFKQHKKEEQDARLFFLPFENALYQLRIEQALQELTLQHKGEEGSLQHMLAAYWPIFKLMNRKQTSYFLKLLPILHDLRGKQDAFEEIAQQILEVPIKTTLHYSNQHEGLEDEIHYNGFGHLLGVDFVMGKSDGQEAIPCLKVQIGPLPQARRTSMYNPNSLSRQLLQSLADYLLPADMLMEVEWLPDTQDSGFFLPDELEMEPSLLGVDTFL